MNYILFDGPFRDNLLPLTFTRPVADIRLGISTLREKWEIALNTTVSVLTEEYLSKKFPLLRGKQNILINASALPNNALVSQIKNLNSGEQLVKNELRIAVRIDTDFTDANFKTEITNEIDAGIDLLKNTWDIFAKNGKYLELDFALLTNGRTSAKLSDTNNVRGDVNDIFIEEGAIVEFAYLNTENGPIYVGKEAEIMEGSKIRGPFAICEHSTTKMDAKIYGATTIGPHCKVGGEINNVVFMGYANKAHDGFLGNAVIGEWCNLGADTNNSNLKNTYEEVKLWSYPEERFVKTALQFCGLIMGDHSKSGINTMFNTGTVVGVSCNIYGAGFQRNFIPSFSWGSPAGMKPYNLKKAIQVAEAVYARRGKDFDQREKEIFDYLSKVD
ncbi:MAG: glucose-1-phosphate thymidylyltransferase [Chlorobi bacterium]|nr:glucose-1-phosphate thymidylyltransferase [Chlorobiota bacterium]